MIDTAGGQQTAVDRPLADLGHARRVAVGSPYFVASALAIPGTDLVLTLPARLADRLAGMAGVRRVAPPAEIRRSRT